MPVIVKSGLKHSETPVTVYTVWKYFCGDNFLLFELVGCSLSKATELAVFSFVLLKLLFETRLSGSGWF